VRVLEADGDGRVVVCGAGDLADGERRVFKVGRRRVGVFRVDGRYVALHGGCPHAGGALCEGPLTGTTLPTDEPYTYEYGREGKVLRCAWHGIEFDVETGTSLVDPALRARTYPVAVEDGAVVVHLRGRGGT
jgi:nitrite reductase/ring-hydroxylating ferredoxin subunit